MASLCPAFLVPVFSSVITMGKAPFISPVLPRKLTGVECASFSLCFLVFSYKDDNYHKS